MKIALVTPNPSPLVLGGAENLWWGLQDEFQKYTEHECDIISIMAPEGNFWELIESYKTFSKLDLSGYDCIISGKYPAWMVEHPYHVCYMLHRLRGLYDTYSPHQQSISFLKEARLRIFFEWLQEGINNPDPDQIPELFNRLQNLRNCNSFEDAFTFPGPLSQAVINYLDNAALSPLRIKRYAAISKTVANRKYYFPPKATVNVLYPPPHLEGYHCGKSDYFFTSSRLDRPKRIDLLINAMKLVKADIPFLIAGTGPDEERLKALAADDSRIQFLGYVSVEEMSRLYGNARAVPFVPVDEDYGLVAIEAMKSSKAIITVNDSGGPCEFVTHGETGYICEPSTDEISKYLSKLAYDEDSARKLGQAAFDKVNSIRWDAVTSGLLDQSAASNLTDSPRLPKLTVATTFRIYPPMNGGQARVFHLYRNLAQFFDIDIISLGSETDVYSEIEIAPGVLEINIPRTIEHSEREQQISRLVGNKPVGDIVSSSLLDLTPNYREALELSMITSQAIIACHPYTIDTIKRIGIVKPLWYEAQDVELKLKSDIFGEDPSAIPLLEEVTRSEKECWKSAFRVFACAQRDLKQLEQLYGPTCAYLEEVPNGVSLEDVHYTDPVQRSKLKDEAGLRSQQIAIFIGSWHGPNLEAVEDIILIAPESPRTRFIVIGSVCKPFEDYDLPINLELMGSVDMETRDLMLSVADVALNPMRLGTGTNLKMLDYMAAGVPVISTGFGARGLLIKQDIHYVEAEIHEFSQALSALSNADEREISDRIVSARNLVEKEYSWQIIAERFAEKIGYIEP